jgi:ParB-like chromosome segregation protein Spo0J
MNTETNPTAAALLEEQIKGISNFNTELVSGGSAKATMKAIGAGSSDLWKVKPQDIVVLDGYNPRVQNVAYFEGIAALAENMVANGFMQDKPLSGYIAKIDGEDKIVLQDGHRRLAAALKAIELGAQIEKVPMVMKERSDNMVDLTKSLLHANEGQPFTTYEKAILAKRFKNFGWDNASISKEMRCTVQAVGQLLDMAGAPQAIHDLVKAGQLSVTAATEMVKKHGEQAIEVAQTTVKNAAAKGKTRATNRDQVEPASPAEQRAKNAKKWAYELYLSLKKVFNNAEAVKKIEDKELEQIDALMTEVEKVKKPKVVKESKPPKAPKAPKAPKTPAAKKTTAKTLAAKKKAPWDQPGAK